MRATLRFPSGVEGVAEFGFRGFYMPRAGVVGTCEKGSIKWDGNKGLALQKNGDVIRESLPTKSTHQLQLEAFVKRISGEESNALPPDGGRVLSIIGRKRTALQSLRGRLLGLAQVDRQRSSAQSWTDFVQKIHTTSFFSGHTGSFTARSVANQLRGNGAI